eukprot:CAMPEP_0119389446 /NCGR_PEP_ID=MMETSP1334-20130426/109392_1 /TAXON_ID=127549 /ORGANISM="Calcidiscus leptoporus, Strain RCC1130" /LENGTH=81 /DNA_ID=CAMNT_0007411711 /DNA_START=24 /DNA_END=266 /DNA_ORIENTATION=-
MTLRSPTLKTFTYSSVEVAASFSAMRARPSPRSFAMRCSQSSAARHLTISCAISLGGVEGVVANTDANSSRSNTSARSDDS